MYMFCVTSCSQIIQQHKRMRQGHFSIMQARSKFYVRRMNRQSVRFAVLTETSPLECNVWIRGAQSFRKPSSHRQILSARTLTDSNFHTEDSQILGATVHNLLAWATMRPSFVHPWYRLTVRKRGLIPSLTRVRNYESFATCPVGKAAVA
jgi:hypothetical protein